MNRLLIIFASGFEKIAAALCELKKTPNEPFLLGRAHEIVSGVGKEANSWFSKNGAEAFDWGIRLPVFSAGVALLGLTGANMTVATTAVAAIIGGSKVVGVLKSKTKVK